MKLSETTKMKLITTIALIGVSVALVLGTRTASAQEEEMSPPLNLIPLVTYPVVNEKGEIGICFTTPDLVTGNCQFFETLIGQALSVRDLARERAQQLNNGGVPGTEQEVGDE